MTTACDILNITLFILLLPIIIPYTCLVPTSSKCGTSRNRERQRKMEHKRRLPLTRTHPVIIVAPPRTKDLLNPSNRIFHLRPDTGQLVSGNVAAQDSYGIKVTGKPRLVATVPRSEWKRMLRRFKEVREEVVVAFPPGPEGEKPRRVWRKRTAPTAETEWVRRCCEMLSEEVEGDGGEMMAVWSVDVVAGCVYHVIHEDIGGHNFSRGPAYGEMYKIQRTDDYLWVSITMKNNWFVHTGEIDDRFEGSWEDGYICGHEEAVQIPDAELRSAIVEEFRRAQMQRRRSADSGYPAQDDEGNY